MPPKHFLPKFPQFKRKQSFFSFEPKIIRKFSQLSQPDNYIFRLALVYNWKTSVLRLTFPICIQASSCRYLQQKSNTIFICIKLPVCCCKKKPFQLPTQGAIKTLFMSKFLVLCGAVPPDEVGKNLKQCLPLPPSFEKEMLSHAHKIAHT